jgi:predicted DNA-binding protein
VYNYDNMQRFYINLTEELKNKLNIEARIRGKTKAEVARVALEKGLEALEESEEDSPNIAKELLKLAERAKREGWSGPKDLSTNHDKYFVQAYEESKGK